MVCYIEDLKLDGFFDGDMDSDMFASMKFVVTNDEKYRLTQLKGYHMPEGFVRKRLKAMFPNCSLFHNVHTRKKYQNGTREFDVIICGDGICFIGEIKSWINIEKLIKDINNVTSGLKENGVSTSIPVYYFIEELVIVDTDDMKLLNDVVNGYTIRLVKVLLTPREIKWMRDEQNRLLARVDMYIKREEVRKKICVKFTNIMDRLQIAIGTYVCGEFGRKQQKLNRKNRYSDIGHYRKQMPYDDFNKFRKIECEYRNIIWIQMRELKRDIINIVYRKQLLDIDLNGLLNDNIIDKKIKQVVTTGKVSYLRNYLEYSFK